MCLFFVAYSINVDLRVDLLLFSSVWQKFNDFVEAAKETIIGAHTKQVNGETVPAWDKDEVDEIVIARVNKTDTKLR